MNIFMDTFASHLKFEISILNNSVILNYKKVFYFLYLDIVGFIICVLLNQHSLKSPPIPGDYVLVNVEQTVNN